MQVELGRIPSAFVPLGNLPLYVHQIEALKNQFPSRDIFLSIPDNFKIRKTDKFLLSKLNINVIEVPADLILGDSILYVINTVGRYDESLSILHGDTYITEFPLDTDIIGLSISEDDYQWEKEVISGNQVGIWCGYFSFSDIRLFARSLTASRGDFVETIRLYQKSRKLNLYNLEKWFDMGHVNTYFRSRTQVTTQRTFNNLFIKDGVVKKSSIFKEKIDAEKDWYINIPAQLKKYTPMFISEGVSQQISYYETEYLSFLPLNELYVHGDLPLIFWKKIFSLTTKVISDFESVITISDVEKKRIDYDFKKIIVNKTSQRLNEYFSSSIENLSIHTSLNGYKLPSINQIVSECQGELFKLPPRYGVSHGDFCFSNILFDSRSNSLKLLDPRGMNADKNPTIIGDLRYDSAKLAHSVIGLYDHIIAGLFTLNEVEPLNFQFHIDANYVTEDIQGYFYRNIKSSGYSCQQILPLVILLFLSMLPLHQDRPVTQRAFIANALRLYISWRSVELCF